MVEKGINMFKALNNFLIDFLRIFYIFSNGKSILIIQILFLQSKKVSPLGIPLLTKSISQIHFLGNLPGISIKLS